MSRIGNQNGEPVWRCDDVEVISGDTKPLRGQPVGVKSFVQGQATRYILRSRTGWELEVADVTWPGRDRDVRTLAYSPTTPMELHRLQRGLRMSIKRRGEAELWVELSQARSADDQGAGWSNLRHATMEQLSEGAGFSVRAALEALGAEVDLREQLLEDQSRRRGYLCAVFPTDRVHVPVICYTLTRVLPVLRGRQEAAVQRRVGDDLEGTQRG